MNDLTKRPHTHSDCAFSSHCIGVWMYMNAHQMKCERFISERSAHRAISTWTLQCSLNILFENAERKIAIYQRHFINKWIYGCMCVCDVYLWSFIGFSNDPKWQVKSFVRKLLEFTCCFIFPLSSNLTFETAKYNIEFQEKKSYIFIVETIIMLSSGGSLHNIWCGPGNPLNFVIFPGFLRIEWYFSVPGPGESIVIHWVNTDVSFIFI